MQETVSARLRLELNRRQGTQVESRIAPFPDWLEQVTPTWNWDWHYQRTIQTALAEITSGQCKRLMLFMPPRHGKSEMTTVRYAAWRLERNPAHRVIIGAYNQTLAEKFSRKCRRIAEPRVALAQDRKAASEWETVAGGGVRAVGVGGGITGMGGDLIVIDDPVKSREEAESEVYREKVWNWYTDDLYSRLEPNGAIVLIMTRWHDDDLAGRILESEQSGQWKVIRLPALAEEDDPLGREIGDPLCPERFDVDALADIQRTMSGYSWESLYQQNPTPKEGSFFVVSKLEIVDAIPANLKACRAWDLAATKAGGDYTAGVKMEAGTDGIFYVSDVARGQWDSDEVRRNLRQTADIDGRRVSVHLPQDPGQAGKDQSQQLIRLLAGYPVKAEPVTGAKDVRAGGFAAQVNAGNVRLLRGDWNKAFIEELRAFPHGKHDDMSDAVSDAFNELAATRKIVWRAA